VSPTFDAVYLGIKDWDYPLKSRSHFLSRALSELGWRVLYVNPQWYPTSVQGARGSRLTEGVVDVGNAISVASIDLGNRDSLSSSSTVGRYRIAAARLSQLFAQLCIKRPIVVLSQPLDILLLTAIEPRFVVCDYMDDYSGYFSSLTDYLDKYLKAANLITCVSPAVCDLIPPGFRDKIFIVRSGARITSVARNRSRGGIVFAGAVNQRVRLDVIAAIARGRPGENVALIGPIQTDVSQVTRLKNVEVVGPIDASALPRRLSQFKVGIIPFRQHGVARYCDPLKFFDYLSAGLSIVSTSIPAVASHGPFVSIADEMQHFVGTVYECLEKGLDPNEVERRESYLTANSWSTRARSLNSAIRSRLSDLNSAVKQ